MRWFSQDNDGRTEFHATAEQAKAAAEASLEWCRDQAAEEEGWPEDTERILWGEVREGATRRVLYAHDETCRNEGGRLACDGADWHETWEYDLLPPVDAAEDAAAEATARAEAAEQRAEALEREVARLRAAGRVIACQWRAVDDMEELNYFALCWDLAYPDSAKLECDRGVPAGLALGNDPSLQDLVAALRLMLAEAQPAGEVSNG